MQQLQKQVYQTKSLKYQFFVRKNQSKDLTLSVLQQKNAIIGILKWLNNYQNIKQLSYYGKNPIVRYNVLNDQFNQVACVGSVRLDCQGKNPYCRYYLQQDQVKGKTNLAQIYINHSLDKLMQLSNNQGQKKQSQKWRGRVQNIFLQFRNYIQKHIINQRQTSIAVRIDVIQN